MWHGHRLSVTGLALTADDTTAYSVSKEGGIVRWDVETGARTKFPAPCRRQWTRRSVADEGAPRAAAALMLRGGAGRHLLYTPADRRILVWDTRSMAHVQELASHRGAVTSLQLAMAPTQLFRGRRTAALKVRA